MLANRKLTFGSSNLPDESLHFYSFINECFVLRKNCSVFLHMDVARIIFYKPSTEAFWMLYLHFVQFSGSLFVWTEFTLPATMPLLLSVAVFWRSANPQLWRVLSYVQYNAKNHIFSQMEKLGTLFFFLFIPIHLIVGYMQLNLILTSNDRIFEHSQYFFVTSTEADVLHLML